VPAFDVIVGQVASPVAVRGLPLRQAHVDPQRSVRVSGTGHSQLPEGERDQHLA
jgi:hypothetical protein